MMTRQLFELCARRAVAAQLGNARSSAGRLGGGEEPAKWAVVRLGRKPKLSQHQIAEARYCYLFLYLLGKVATLSPARLMQSSPHGNKLAKRHNAGPLFLSPTGQRLVPELFSTQHHQPGGNFERVSYLSKIHSLARA
jgi:hypothetical protein